METTQEIRQLERMKKNLLKRVEILTSAIDAIRERRENRKEKK